MPKVLVPYFVNRGMVVIVLLGNVGIAGPSGDLKFKKGVDAQGRKPTVSAIDTRQEFEF